MTDKTPRLLALPDALEKLELARLTAFDVSDEFGNPATRISMPAGDFSHLIQSALAHLSACGDAVAWMTEDGERVVPKRTKDAGSNLAPPSALAIYSVPLYRHPSPLPEPEVRELVEAAEKAAATFEHYVNLHREKGTIAGDQKAGENLLQARNLRAALTAPRLLDYLRGQQP